MYNYYKHIAYTKTPLLKYPYECVRVEERTPCLWKSRHAFMWRVCAGIMHLPYKEYCLLANNIVVAKAEVTGKLPIFPFMPKHGIHIGPCVTMPAYRGRGYYPYLLDYIVRLYGQENCYIMVEETNTASIRGVEKVGFNRFATGKKDIAGRYVIVNNIQPI